MNIVKIVGDKKETQEICSVIRDALDSDHDPKNCKWMISGGTSTASEILQFLEKHENIKYVFIDNPSARLISKLKFVDFPYVTIISVVDTK